MTVPPDWMVYLETSINGRRVEVGTELKITGERGRMKFVRLVETATSTWIDVKDADGRWRAFRPSRVKTVHRLKKRR